MEFSAIKDKFAGVFRQYYLPIILGIGGIVFLLYGLISSVLPQRDKGDILFEAAQTTSSDPSASDLQGKSITVDVEGAVIKPGVYTLKEDARIQDALIAAGGMNDEADRGKIAKILNLASKITDGGKIYIPFVGETIKVAQIGTSEGSSSDGSSVMGDSTGSLININTASAQELDTLSGVGPATAEKIISNRPYETVGDLVSKKSVGQSVFSKIKDKISTY